LIFGPLSQGDHQTIALQWFDGGCGGMTDQIDPKTRQSTKYFQMKTQGQTGNPVCPEAEF
jgi:hypothetical protein